MAEPVVFQQGTPGPESFPGWPGWALIWMFTIEETPSGHLTFMIPLKSVPGIIDAQVVGFAPVIFEDPNEDIPEALGQGWNGIMLYGGTAITHRLNVIDIFTSLFGGSEPGIWVAFAHIPFGADWGEVWEPRLNWLEPIGPRNFPNLFVQEGSAKPGPPTNSALLKVLIRQVSNRLLPQGGLGTSRLFPNLDPLIGASLGTLFPNLTAGGINDNN